MAITKDYEFKCQTCREAFQVFLPEQTTFASFDKCPEDDMKHHSLPLTSRCQNCGNLNTVYYCISGHTKQQGSSSLYVACRFKTYIYRQSCSNVVGIRVLLRCKRCDSDFYAGRIVSSESSFLGSDYDRRIKECPFCMTLETYFQEDYFLDPGQ